MYAMYSMILFFWKTYIKLNLKLKLVFRPLFLFISLVRVIAKAKTLNSKIERCPSYTRNINPQSRPACFLLLEIFDLKSNIAQYKLSPPSCVGTRTVIVSPRPTTNTELGSDLTC